MFGTLHWNPRRKEAEFVKQPHATSHRERNPACDRCRLHKVRCHTTTNSCSRCTRFRKPCTFTSTKQQSNLKTGKGNMPVTLHECQLDFTVQSAPLVSQDQRQQQSPTKPPSPPSTERACDSENGNEQDFMVGFRFESPGSFFDVSSFLDSSGPRDDQDDTFLPFFSPSETLLSPPPIQGEDQIFRFTSHDGSISGVCSSTLTDCSVIASPGASPKGCRCLAAAALAVEEFETSCNNGNRAELDSVISHQKKAVKCCRCMVDCTSCTSKRENVVLLIFIVERIVAACSHVVQLYNTGEDVPEPPFRTCLPTEIRSFQVPDGQMGAWNPDPGDSSPISTRTRSSSEATLAKWRELLVGDYEVSSQLEWEHLMRVLISVQLHTVMELLADTRKLRGAALTEMQGASLTRSGDSIAKLGGRMSVFC